jgi:hypothetical protein
MAFWVVLFAAIIGGAIWGLSRLPRRRPKGDSTIMDGGSMGSGTPGSGV